MAVGTRTYADSLRDRMSPDRDLLKIVLEFWTSLDLGNKKNKNLRQTVIDGHDSTYEVHKATEHAIKRGDVETLRLLLDFYTANDLRPNQTISNGGSASHHIFTGKIWFKC